MLLGLAKRLLRETDSRLLAKFLWSFGFRSVLAVRRFDRRLAAGAHPYPAFLFISVTTACNLRCRGCWVTVGGPPQTLDAETLDRIIRQSKRQGVRFYGLLGGEPLMHRGLWAVLDRHRDCYFQIFTNGTLLSDRVARTMRRLGNVTPLISIEGAEAESDARRGGRDVYRRSLEGLARCRRHRLITGVATSVCRSNLHDLVSDAFVKDLVDRGAHYLWYYIYRPMGADPAHDLVLDADQILAVRRFIVEARQKWPIAMIDAYWDADGQAVCPAAVGISCHINPWGDVEPCPPIQFAVENVRQNGDLYETIGRSAFLEAFRGFCVETTRGCVLLEQPDRLAEFFRSQGASDTSGRGSGFKELAAMARSPSHHLPGREVPEAKWFYRFAKRHWYFGFGAYG